MMTESEVSQEVNSVQGKRFYAPELGKNRQNLAFNNIEALILISLSNNSTGDALFQEEETFELRKAIDQGKLGIARLELTKPKIRQIEKLLPLFGTVDESVYGALRIKLSSAILNMDTVTFEEVNEDANPASESPSSTKNHSKDRPRP